jgi:hypothetical protein
MAANTPEPNLVRGQQPEQALGEALMTEVASLLTQAEVKFILLENFGLDIAAFVRREEKRYARFIEVKAFVGSRAGGVGFGNRKGEGSQVDLLLHQPSELKVVDPLICWVLGVGTVGAGNPRYAFFTSAQAREAAMGSVGRGKQNNLRITGFHDQLITWDELSGKLNQFLLG